MLVCFLFRLKHRLASTFSVCVGLTSVILFSVALPCGAAVVHVSFGEMTQKADAIFIGTVIDQQSRYGPNKKMIFTDVYFGVTELVHSTESAALIGQNMMLSFAGGEVEGQIIKVSDVPSLETGATYLIFTLMDGKAYASPIIGSFQGLFKVIADESSGISYPLTYGGRCIAEIKEGDLVTGPSVARIVAGTIEKRDEVSDVEFHAVPPQPTPGTGQIDARANVSMDTERVPERIMSLDEFVAEIHEQLQMVKGGER